MQTSISMTSSPGEPVTPPPMATLGEVRRRYLEAAAAEAAGAARATLAPSIEELAS